MNRRWLIIGGGLLLITLAVLVAAYEVSSSSSSSSKTQHAAGTATALGPLPQFLGVGNSELLGIDSNSTIRNLSGNTSLAALQAIPSAAVWSATSDLAAIRPASNPTHWQIIRTTTGEILGELSGRANRLVWSPKGDRVAYLYQLTDNTQNLTIADVTGSDWTVVVDLPASLIDLAWLPNETYALTLDATDNATLSLIGLSSHSIKALAQNVQSFQVSPNGTQLLIAQPSIDDTTQSLVWQYAVISLDQPDQPSNPVPIPITPRQPSTIHWGSTDSELIYLEQSDSELMLQRYDLSTNQQTTITSAKTVPPLIGLTWIVQVTDTAVFFVSNNTVYHLSLP